MAGSRIDISDAQQMRHLHFLANKAILEENEVRGHAILAEAHEQDNAIGIHCLLQRKS